MWNRNNPYEYSDPSGYFPEEVLADAWGGAGNAANSAGGADSEGASTADNPPRDGGSDVAHEMLNQLQVTDVQLGPGKKKGDGDAPKQGSKLSKKERATNIPSWVHYEKDPRPGPNESAQDFAQRMMQQHYPPSDPRHWLYKTTREYSQILKNATRRGKK